MVKLLLKRNRYASTSGYTIGRLYVDEGGYLCDILEPENRGLHQEMPLEQIKAKKITGKTAIPAGTYRVKLLVSPTLKGRYYAKPYEGRFPCLQDVPGFSGILIHPGNTTEDTRGCLLPGTAVKGEGRVYDSVLAYQDLMNFYLWPAYGRKDEIWITIE